MKLKKTLFMLGIALLVGIFTMSQVSYAAKYVDELRPKRGPESSDTRNWAEGFLSPAGESFAHDKIFRARVGKAFREGRAVNIYGHRAEEDLTMAAARYVELNPLPEGTDPGLVEDRLRKARQFIDYALDDQFIESVAKKILDSSPTEQGQALYDAVQKASAIEDEKERLYELRLLLLRETRFVCFLFGNQGMDPYLYNIGEIASEEHRAIVAHAGRFAYTGSEWVSYEGSEHIKGGPRTIYLTLARIGAYADLLVEPAEASARIRAFQELMSHELTDLVAGHRDEALPTLARVNAEIDRVYETDVVRLARGDRRGAITLDTDQVSLEKYSSTNDLGMREVFAIKGSSKVHPDVPKGSRKITLTAVKADVGSIGGHGSAPGIMLEAVADIWSKAAAEGLIIDFFITRVGDDISVTVTHLKGRDDEEIHRTAWDGFINASVISTDSSFYGAGQDLLVESFSGNLKGAGPSFAEMEFVERESEPVIIGQADKTAPGAFNRGLYGTYLDPRTPYVHLSGDAAKNLKIGIIDFDYNDSVGREGTFPVSSFQDIYYYLGYPDRYSVTRIVDGKGEDVAAVTAQRLGKIAGKYVGKDDPMFMARTQKQLPAVGEVTAPFLRGDYIVPGWMRGSNKGPFLPVALPEAKIGMYDGPPLLSIWSFNINNGRIGGFMDLLAANPAIRHIQNVRTEKALSLLDEGWDEMNLRLGQEELEYQEGVKKLEDRTRDIWVENEPVEGKKEEPLASNARLTSRENLGEATQRTRIILFLGEEVLKNIHDFKGVLSALSRDQIAVILVDSEVQRNTLASSAIRDYDNFEILTLKEAGLEGFDLASVMATDGFTIKDLSNIFMLPVTDSLTVTHKQLEALLDKV